MNKASRRLFRKYRLRYRRYSRVWYKNYHHHPYLLPIVGIIAMVGISLFLFAILRSHKPIPIDSHTVILYHDKKNDTLPTRAKTVGEFLDKYGLTINEGDVVEPTTDTEIQEDSFHINVYRAMPVLILDGTKRTYALSAASTPRSIAQQVGIEVYPEDSLESRPSEDFLNGGGVGQEIVIDRATPTAINLYGTTLNVRTHAKTVAELFKEKNIVLAADDTVQPALTTPLTQLTLVFVVRNGSQVVTTEEAVPMTTQTVEDKSLSFGTTVVRQVGAPGKKAVTYQITLRNGKEVSRTKIQEVVTVQPVTQIVARGLAVSIPSDKESLMNSAGIAASDYPYVNYIISRESGWCPTKWQGQIGYCPGYYSALHDTSSGFGYGLCQSTPAIKMASIAADWQVNPVTQLRWCSGYAQSRYGGWAGAYQHWLSYSWW